MPQDSQFRPAPPSRSLQNSLNIGPLTAVIMGLCIVVALLTKLGTNERFLVPLLITVQDRKTLPEVLHGELWRVLTPIFLHFGLPHIVFNMLAFKDLGTLVERLVGSRTLLAFVLIAGIGSNLVQFRFGDTFVFGGLSGVVYALFGYVWMKSQFDPFAGFRLHQQTVIMMIGWFFLCVFGVIPHVANWAHGAGLVIGMIWGFAAAKMRRAA
ncbi:MAG TPA: rhomboid family intramembrane serine protease [Chthoniobacteraceae bacterium]|nr:rhomboid family intramembrane serine protease [Chthoniobacteraceae bacterium]